MDYVEFNICRSAIPDINEAVLQLFERARAASEQRFFLTILDLHTHTPDPTDLRPDGNPKRYPLILTLGLGIQQYSEFLSTMSHIDLSEAESDSERNLMRRLQMLAYSQFWEHLEVQTLLLQLSSILKGAPYEPNLLWESFYKKPRSTNSIYEEIISKSRAAGITLARVVELLHFSQIRNAFSHSQFYFIPDLVVFENSRDLQKPFDVPSLKVEMWDKLFADTLEFAAALFAARRVAVEELISKCPLTFSVPEIEPFAIEHTSGEFRFVQVK